MYEVQTLAAVPLMLIPNLARFFVLIKVDPKCYDMAKMAKSLFIFFFFFIFGLTTQESIEKYHMICHMSYII